MSSAELKAVDLDTTTVGISGGVTAVLLLNGISAGSGMNQRIGRVASMKSLMLRLQYYPESASSSYGHIRTCLVYDAQANGVAPVYADIFRSLSAAGAVASTTDSGLNLDNRQRFRILFDSLQQVGGASTATAITNNQGMPNRIDSYKKLNLPIQFKSDSSLIGDIATGALYLVMCSSSPAGLGVNAVWNTRLRYTD